MYFKQKVTNLVTFYYKTLDTKGSTNDNAHEF